MAFDFDTVVERRGTGSIKYDGIKAFGRAEDTIPLWVADMDFPMPEPAVEALVDRARHGIFGYPLPPESYYDAVVSWLSSHHSWDIDPSWIVPTPGVVHAISLAINSFSNPGDTVLIQPPVYYPFGAVTLENSRCLCTAPLDYENGAYALDLDAFEKVVEKYRPKLFILCNPHNPVGRVWTAAELMAMGEVCLSYDVLVISDEIHADFARPGFTHTVFASLDDRFADITITCTAPSKTFNIAGLQVSNIVIGNHELKDRFKEGQLAEGLTTPNVMGLVAAEACYRYGGDWLEALKTYLEGNLDLMRSHLATCTPQLHLVEPESTYLTWVDCRSLGLDDDGLKDLVEERARLWLDLGILFGNEGSGFIRFNNACPKATLERALDRLADAVNSL